MIGYPEVRYAANILPLIKKSFFKRFFVPKSEGLVNALPDFFFLVLGVWLLVAGYWFLDA